MSFHHVLKTTRLLLLLALSFAGSIAQAAMLGCDSFRDYTSNFMLMYQIGGVGFRGHWGAVDWTTSFHPDRGESIFQVTYGSLTSSSVNSFGSRLTLNASTNCEIKRKFGVPLGLTGTTRYLRFLIRADSPPPGYLWPVGKYLGVELRKGTSTELYVGKIKGGKLGTSFGHDSGGSIETATSMVSETTYTMVLKIEFRDGNDVVSLFVNPPNNVQEPAATAARQDIDVGQPDILAVVGNIAMSLDEIVLADTFIDAMQLTSPPLVPLVSIEANSMKEGNSGTNSLAFTARLSSAVPYEVSVDYLTSDREAKAGEDYVRTAGTLVFPPGTTAATGLIGVIGDLQTRPMSLLLSTLTGR